MAHAPSTTWSDLPASFFDPWIQFGSLWTKDASFAFPGQEHAPRFRLGLAVLEFDRTFMIDEARSETAAVKTSCWQSLVIDGAEGYVASFFE